MRSPRDFNKPLALGAPQPVTEIPVKPSRMIHFFDPSNPKMEAKLPELARKGAKIILNVTNSGNCAKNGLGAFELELWKICFRQFAYDDPVARDLITEAGDNGTLLAIYLLDEPFVGVDAATEAVIIELLRSMKAEGRTLVVVHHDLQSAPEYFDSILMLNMRLVAFGPTSQVFTHELLQKTYGGRLTILSEAAEQVAGMRR